MTAPREPADPADPVDPIRREQDPLDELRRELDEIKTRNARVEREKAWERSWTRRLVIAAATWLAAWLWLVSLRVSDPAKQALVPGAAYLLSTFSLPVVKRWWVRLRT